METATFVLDCFAGLLQMSANDVYQIGRGIAIPEFAEEVVEDLFRFAGATFREGPMILNVDAPCYVVGDIHGNFHELIRIFSLTGRPPDNSFLFLGDYVDRGDYSIEVLMLLFAMRVAFPEHVFMIRGNHEFEAANGTYGFLDECNNRYPVSRVYRLANQAFNYMPLAAVINSCVLCVHGGVSPALPSLDALAALERPLYDFRDDVVSDLVWSDPMESQTSWIKSTRGLGVHFGVSALREFLRRLKMREMIRAHQCVPHGIMVFANGLLTTVFSCSGYKGTDNHCGILAIDADLEKQQFAFPPMDTVSIADAHFQKAVKVRGNGLRPSGSIALRRVSDPLANSAGLSRAHTIVTKAAVQQLLGIGPRGKAEQPLPLVRGAVVSSPSLLVSIARLQARRT